VIAGLGFGVFATVGAGVGVLLTGAGAGLGGFDDAIGCSFTSRPASFWQDARFLLSEF
jgi:hypothetical protein